MRDAFFGWLDGVLSGGPAQGAAAWCFNLYEESDGGFSAQLVGAERFDENDPDWPCDEVFTSGEDLLEFAADGWEEAQEAIARLVKDYLEDGRHASLLCGAEAVAVGFVDGDLDVIYKKAR
ncbi:MAG: hypothetical protein IKS43_03685 [Clostridia bacterium]|nr:hypothetical protein [Clostridia bacterium]